MKVVVVGAGMIADAGHLPAWRALGPRVKVVAVSSGSLEKARRTAERHGVPGAYDDWRRMLDEESPDIVSVCTPNASHREIVEEALDRGAHVLCEKPIATSLADARSMYRKAEEKALVLMAAQTARFSGRAQAARRIVDADTLGDLYYGEATLLRRRGIPTWGRFHMKEHSGGGPLFDLGVHALDLIYWLMGNPKTVAVSGLTFRKLSEAGTALVTTLAAAGAPAGVADARPYDPQEFDVEEMAVALIRLERGGAIVLRTSWAANVPSSGVLDSTLLGTRAGMGLYPVRVFGGVAGYQADLVPDVPADPDVPFWGHRGITEHMLRVLAGEEASVVRGEEVINVMSVLEAIYLSAERGHEVAIKEVQG